MRYHLFDRVRICETTGMQDGYLRIDVVNRENNFPIEGAGFRSVMAIPDRRRRCQNVIRADRGDCGMLFPVSTFTGRTEPGKAYADYTWK